MKAIVFTLDAVFALVITIISISILLFFTYYVQAPYALHYSNAQTIFSNLASATVESVQNSSVIAKGIATQFSGANETSPDFLSGPQENSSNVAGPLKPVLDFIFNPGNTITTSVVADYGNIYFAANTILYAVNATTNRTAWTKNTINNVALTPALYSGALFYANSTNLTAVDARTGRIIWSTSAIATITPLTSQIVVYDNEVIFGATDNYVHAYYAGNGSSAWSNNIGAAPVAIAVIRGNIAVKASNNNVNILVQGGTSAQSLTSTAYAGGNAPTRPVGAGTRIYLGTGTSANAIYMNSTVVGGFPVGTSQTINGLAAYRNYIVYQTTAGVVALAPSGSSYWSVTMPSSFGTALTNATPAIGGSVVYTLWANGLAAQNLTTGSVLWFALIPKVTISPYMTLAYGRLYVTANNRIRVYGSCAAPLHASLLAAVAAMYMNSQQGCGTALLNNVYPAANYSFFVGAPATNTMQAASFNGGTGYISAHNSGSLNISQVSASFWINVTAYPASGSRLVNYGDNGTCLGAVTYCGWFFYLSSSGVPRFSIMNANQINATGIALNKNRWYMLTGVFNGSYASLYINSNAPYSKNSLGIGGIASTTPNINLTIGAGLTSDARYFTGNMANLQIYSKPFTRPQVAQLYVGGAKGVPLKGYGLISWYPLAGDPNDYALFNAGYVTGSTKFVTKTYASPAFSNAYEISRASVLLPVLNYTSGISNTIQVGVYSWS